MRKQNGFTIIELMIATSVFSVILLLCTIALLQIGRTYYKGLTESKIQQAARSIIDEISRGIQFSGNPIASTPTGAGSSYVFCIGDQRYSVMLDQEVENNPSSMHQGYHALVSDNYPGCNNSSPKNTNFGTGTLTNGARELLGLNMRLTSLSVSNVANTNLYSINLRLVYGDDDVLNSTQTACARVSAGTQFCAVSELDTVVQKRI
jgi:prepilin-type N-terminal cleavage/methylation domain-containing protein